MNTRVQILALAFVSCICLVEANIQTKLDGIEASLRKLEEKTMAQQMEINRLKLPIPSPACYAKVHDPTLLNGVQVVGGPFSTNSMYETCWERCEDSKRCQAFVIRRRDCLLLGDDSIGKRPYIHRECNTVYALKSASFDILAYRISTGMPPTDSYILIFFVNSSPADELHHGTDLSKPLKAAFKNSIMDKWATSNIQKTTLALRTGTGSSVALTFGATSANADKISWMNQKLLLTSPWTDLSTTATTNYFSVKGWNVPRQFFINRNYGGCPNDAGWLVADSKQDPCPWGNAYTTNGNVAILYSTLNTYVQWQKTRLSNGRYANVGLATDLMVYVTIKMG